MISSAATEDSNCATSSEVLLATMLASLNFSEEALHFTLASFSRTTKVSSWSSSSLIASSLVLKSASMAALAEIFAVLVVLTQEETVASSPFAVSYEVFRSETSSLVVLY